MRNVAILAKSDESKSISQKKEIAIFVTNLNNSQLDYLLNGNYIADKDFSSFYDVKGIMGFSGESDIRRIADKFYEKFPWKYSPDYREKIILKTKETNFENRSFFQCYEIFYPINFENFISNGFIHFFKDL